MEQVPDSVIQAAKKEVQRRLVTMSLKDLEAMLPKYKGLRELILREIEKRNSK